MDLLVRKTAYKGDQMTSQLSRHQLHLLGTQRDNPFPITYTQSEQKTDLVTFELEFYILNGTYLFEKVYLSINKPIPNRVIFVNGYMNYGFSLRLSIFQTQRFHIRRNRYNLVQCQQACGLALFINYPLTNEICLQVGSEIYYFKLHNYQDHLDISRVLLIELLTRYSSQTGEPIEVRRTFFSRPCSMNEIEKRNIKSNLEIVVINSKEVNTSIYFVDVDLNRQGPFSIPIITNYTQKYSELINASLNITGLIFTNVSAFHQKNYDSRNPNAIVMIKGNITYRSCFAWNMILEVNNHTNEDIELGSEIYGFRRILRNYLVFNKIRLDNSFVFDCFNTSEIGI